MAIETVLRSDKSPYDGQDAQVIYMYVKAQFTGGDMTQLMKELRNMGYNVGEPEDRSLPNLGSYIPRITKAFTGWLEETLPTLGKHFTGEEGQVRVEGIIELVDDYLHEEEGPNMVAILDMAKQMELTEEQVGDMMSNIKRYMNTLMIEIL